MACQCSVLSGGWKHVVQFRTSSIFCRWKAHLANQCRCERGCLTQRGSTKMADSLIWMSSSFNCPWLRKVQTKCNSSAKKHVILALRAEVRHHTGHHSINLGEVRSKCQLVNWSGINIPSSAMQAQCGMLVWYAHPESDHRMTQPGVAKPCVAATPVTTSSQAKSWLTVLDRTWWTASTTKSNKVCRLAWHPPPPPPKKKKLCA